jgi:hypothetical protein
MYRQPSLAPQFPDGRQMNASRTANCEIIDPKIAVPICNYYCEVNNLSSLVINRIFKPLAPSPGVAYANCCRVHLDAEEQHGEVAWSGTDADRKCADPPR